ncbi:MAG: site-2 protease family protein [Candidatus Competibacteraceae bacterium]
MQYLYSIFINLIIYVPPILFAIVLHEVAHGWAALRCGDITAWSQGRLSLNPLCHVDPIGTVLVPTLSLFLFGFIFGWAKPVPVNYYRLRHPKQDMALVALAGPGANLVMAFGWGLVMAIGKIILLLGMPLLGVLLERMGEIGIYTNVFIGVLNMLPIPPLDGSRVLMGVLPDVFGRLVARVEPYGLILIPLLLTTGILNIWPLVVWLYNFIFSFFS